MVQVLSAEARISATDQTGDVFARIGAKLRGLASAAKALDTDFGTIAKSGAALDRAGGIQNFRQNVPARGEGSNPLSEIAGGFLGRLVIAEATIEITRATINAAAEGAHERVRDEAAGMTAEEIKEAEAISGEMSQKYKSLSQTSILHQARNIRSVVGSFEEATKILDPLLQLRVIAQGAHPERAAELEEDFDKLVKGMEIKGVTQNLPAFVHYMDNMAKALNVFGDTLRPTDYYEMFKYGRAATSAMSDEFMLKTAPTLAQELGGSSAGTALSSLYTQLVGGRMSNRALAQLVEYGLVDEEKVLRTKTGAVKGVLPGGILGQEYLQPSRFDPYLWTQNTLLPALAQHGVNDPSKIQEVVAALASQRTGAQALSIFATQQPRIEKDWALIEKAKALEAAKLFAEKDPYTVWKGVHEQGKNLLQAATSPLVGGSLSGLNWLSDQFAANAARINEVNKRGVPPPPDSSLIGDWWRNYQNAPPPPAAPGPAIAPPLFHDKYERPATLFERGTLIEPGAYRAPDPQQPAKAEVVGNATLDVKVTAEPSPDFLTRVQTTVNNAINAFRATNAPATGTAGSTGKSMPESGAAPQ